MSTLGLTILVAVGAISFTFAVVTVLVPMSLFVRMSLVSLGFTGWFLLPFVAPGHNIDIAALYWFGVALWAVGAWGLGLAAGVLTRSALQWRHSRERHLST